MQPQAQGERSGLIDHSAIVTCITLAVVFFQSDLLLTSIYPLTTDSVTNEAIAYVLLQIRYQQVKNHRSIDSDGRSVRRAGDRIHDLLER